MDLSSEEEDAFPSEPAVDPLAFKSEAEKLKDELHHVSLQLTVEGPLGISSQRADRRSSFSNAVVVAAAGVHHHGRH